MSNSQDNPVYLQRQSKLALSLQNSGLDALALNPGPSLVYLTGLHFHLSERPVVVIFRPDKTPIIVLPELESAKVNHTEYPLRPFTYGEDPLTWENAFRQAADVSGLEGRKIGVETRQMRVLELKLLEAAVPTAQFVSAGESIAALRMHKDEAEISAMRKAVAIAQLAFQATLPSISPGVSEAELAAELTVQLLRNGSASQLAFSPIVASGPNSANPHAFPSDRRLQPGDLLILDWGANFAGYTSDLTRTLAIGEIDPELAEIAHIVEQANRAARQLAAPGISAGDVDRAARQVIEQAGYGKFFIHRTGHGLGLEGHEEPYIRSGNTFRLAPGMTFTIEPGIYLPERGGVRIEDNVVVTSTGAESLSDLPRQLISIA
jgi:Xaa-Pro dipeptidase